MEWFHLFVAGVSLVAVFLVYKYFFVKWFGRWLDRKGIHPTSRNGLMMIIKIITVIIGIVIVLWGFGFSLTTIGIAGTVISFTIALASEQVLGNFVAGIYIIVTHPFYVGDYIHVGGVQEKLKASLGK